jgi:hypothetical protein
MSLKKGEEREETKRRLFLYFLCPTCGVKLHLDAYWCWKCGNQANWNANKKNGDGTLGAYEVKGAYASDDPEDGIYCRKMNDCEICMTCKNTQLNRTCAYFHCFGSGRGNCGVCERTPNSPFLCCRERREEKERNPPETTVERMLRGRLFKGKPPDKEFVSALVKAVEKEREIMRKQRDRD